MSAAVQNIINRSGLSKKDKAALQDAVAGRGTKAAKGIYGSAAEPVLDSILAELSRDHYRYFPCDEHGIPIVLRKTV